MVKTRKREYPLGPAPASTAPAPALGVSTVSAAPTATAEPTVSTISVAQGTGRSKKRSAGAPAKEPASKRKKINDPTENESADEAAPDAEVTEAVAGPGEVDADHRLLHDSSTEGALPVTTGKRTRAEVDDEGTQGQSSPKKAKTASSVQSLSARAAASPTRAQEQLAEAHEEAAEEQPDTDASDRPDDENPGLPIGEVEDESADAKFLREAIGEISKLKHKKRTQHSENIRIVKPFLRSMKQPFSEALRTSVDSNDLDEEEAPAAYALTADEARSFLASDRVIEAPVFVVGGAKKLFDSGDARRPFDQVLNDWFLDPEEIYTVLNPGGLGNGERSIQWMRKHFLTHNGHVQYPWNFADILNPVNLMATPEFLDSTNCRLLRDLDRAVLFGIGTDDVCLEDCENEKSDVDTCCKQHTMTLAQLTTLQNDLALWRGTLMLADAGAITLSHRDKVLFGTWISCYEGEIGFAWLSHPDQTVIDSFLKNSSKVVGNWLYKVIRPGESLYMPPGTIHTVFRRPQGTQTLGMAGHILRRSTGLESWLSLLHQDLQKDLELKRDFAKDHEMYIIPPLMERLGHFIELAEKEGTVDRFGGQAKVDRAKKLIKEVDNDIMKMRKAVTDARATAASGKGSESKGSKTTAAKPATSKTMTTQGKASTDTGGKKTAAKPAATKGKRAEPAKGKKTGK